jgi:hypothetical protein
MILGRSQEEKENLKNNSEFGLKTAGGEIEKIGGKGEGDFEIVFFNGWIFTVGADLTQRNPI